MVFWRFREEKNFKKEEVISFVGCYFGLRKMSIENYIVIYVYVLYFGLDG